ncbi:MAG: UDP-N-acetylmuramate--L-alanine ligase, partial [Anaerolineae bacterium]|nr:UDP-N-acetylmuramate--L-alanine ligase [Anaerolineae bacterium]
DVVVLADIYGAGETPIADVTSQVLAQRIRAHGHPSVRYVGERANVAPELGDLVLPGDIVVTLGAGDISHSGPELLSLLGAR